MPRERVGSFGQIPGRALAAAIPRHPLCIASIVHCSEALPGSGKIVSSKLPGFPLGWGLEVS